MEQHRDRITHFIGAIEQTRRVPRLQQAWDARGQPVEDLDDASAVLVRWFEHLAPPVPGELPPRDQQILLVLHDGVARVVRMNPVVDVVLPGFDEAAALPDVLAGMPSNAGYRAVVADNGSSDGSVEVAARSEATGRAGTPAQ